VPFSMKSAFSLSPKWRALSSPLEEGELCAVLNRSGDISNWLGSYICLDVYLHYPTMIVNQSRGANSRCLHPGHFCLDQVCVSNNNVIGSIPSMKRFLNTYSGWVDSIKQ